MSAERLCLVSYSWVGRKPAWKVNGVSGILTACSQWSHYIDTTWLVLADMHALHGRLAPFFGGKGEFFLIVALEPDAPWMGLLPEEAWDWLRKRKGEAEHDSNVSP